jgi:voltage-gated potassium channel
MKIRPLLQRTPYSFQSNSQIKRPLIKALLILSCLVIGHVVAMTILEGLSLWDSVWLTLTTLTTVGYGDLSAKTPLGQLATISLMYIAAITLVTFLIRDYVDFRLARFDLIKTGNWNWNMEKHILIINAPKYNSQQFFNRLVTQIRMDDDYKDTPILLLNMEFTQGLPAQLQNLNVRHATGSGNNEADLEKSYAHKAMHILVLSRDEYHSDSDSISFDIADRLARHQLGHITLVECVDDANRARIQELGIKSLLRPIRSYPEILVRAMDAPGSEVVIEDMFTRNHDHPERFSIWLEGERWADVVNCMVQSGVGTPMAYMNKEGDITVHPKGDEHVVAQSLIILVKSDNVPTQDDVNNAFTFHFQKSISTEAGLE